MPDPPLPPIPIASRATTSSNSTSTATSTAFISTTSTAAPTRTAPPSPTATDDPLALVPTNARSSNDATIRAGLTVAALGPIVIFNVLLLIAIAASVWCCAKRRRHAKMIRFRLPNSAVALPPDPVVREALLRPADNRMLDTIGRTASAAGTLPRYATIDRIRQQQHGSHHTDRPVGPATLPRALRGSRHASQSVGHARRFSDLVTTGPAHWNPHAPAFMSSTTSSLFPAMPPPEYGAHHLHAPATRPRSLTVPALLSSLTLAVEDDGDDGPLDSHLVREIQQHRAERSRPTTPTSASSRGRIGHAAVMPGTPTSTAASRASYAALATLDESVSSSRPPSPCDSSSIPCDGDSVVP
ncbi:hypothetical protein GGF32_001474 [Allomyces javanicus]|nr:hypothetical protein GGF32_001474 [Allomyces javanicus]